MTDENNFKPLFHLNPPRIENAQAEIKCKSLAISLYYCTLLFLLRLLSDIGLIINKFCTYQILFCKSVVFSIAQGLQTLRYGKNYQSKIY